MLAHECPRGRFAIAAWVLTSAHVGYEIHGETTLQAMTLATRFLRMRLDVWWGVAGVWSIPTTEEISSSTRFSVQTIG